MNHQGHLENTNLWRKQKTIFELGEYEIYLRMGITHKPGGFQHCLLGSPQPLMPQGSRTQAVFQATGLKDFFHRLLPSPPRKDWKMLILDIHSWTAKIHHTIVQLPGGKPSQLLKFLSLEHKKAQGNGDTREVYHMKDRNENTKIERATWRTEKIKQCPSKIGGMTQLEAIFLQVRSKIKWNPIRYS